MGGVRVGEPCVAEGTCMAGGMHVRRDSHYSGRYASYWNAFLFTCIFIVSFFRLVLVRSWDITAEPAATEPSLVALTDKKVM